MPNRMIYISAAITDSFDKEPNKSGLINKLLAHHYGQTHVETATTPAPLQEKATPPNLGRACCLLATPCRHWTFNGDTGVWTNSLTGEVKEA